VNAEILGDLAESVISCPQKRRRIAEHASRWKHDWLGGSAFCSAWRSPQGDRQIVESYCRAQQG